ncbi:armadillo-type protein [Xylariaceae sp. FL0016]|nr:armadillo-type protein [Xylariaceae sp. FL0016]
MGASSDKTSQPMGSTFGHTTWQSNGIWGSGSVIGSSLNQRRDTSGSKGSNEPSPTTASGSAQLNPLSEPTGWLPPRPQLWNHSGSTQGPTHSGSASPSRTRESFQHSFSDMNTGSHVFPSRPPVGQNGRTVAPGSVDISSSAAKIGSFNGDFFSSEDVNSALPGVHGVSHLGLNSNFRRNSTDPSYANFGAARPGNFGPRRTDPESSTPPTRSGDTSQFPFAKGPSRTNSHSHRPSVPNASVGLPAEVSRTNTFGFASGNEYMNGLEDTFKGIGLGEGAEPGPGTYNSNTGFTPSVNQSFQLNANSQPWQHDASNGGRFGQGLQNETWIEAYGNKRHSAERSSPSGSTYRPGLHSPSANGGTPNQRLDPWSRPSSRDPRIEFGGQQNSQYLQQQLQQQSGYYPYYNPQLAHLNGGYDPYLSQNTFRAMQVPPYNLPVMPGMPQLPFRSGVRDTDLGKGARSRVLEDFRANAKSAKRLDLKDIYGHVVEFCGDQFGSRFIQDKLQTANSDEKEQVFKEILPNAVQLMKDVFGNYVIQKFFEHGNQVQKKLIAAQMKGKLAELSMQMYACRVVQKVSSLMSDSRCCFHAYMKNQALEHVLVEQQTEIVEELKENVMSIIKDQNGNHVIQKIIQMVPRLCIPFIMDAFRGHIDSLASHNYGCRVIQRILEYGTDAEKKALMTDLHACAPKLITDQFGNYVTQHIIEHGLPADRSRMIQLVIERLVPLSKHKFASNVVEKCIQYGTPEERMSIRVKLTALNSDGQSALQKIMMDQYGNYVIQKLLGVLRGKEHKSFVDEVQPQIEALKKGPSGGRHILALDKLLAQLKQPPVSVGDADGDNIVDTPPLPLPNLAVEVSSAAATPSLTTEQNSPQSDSPPSTNSSALEESVATEKVDSNPVYHAVELEEA